MYLIKNIEEYNLLKPRKNFIAENREIYLKLKHLKIHYLYQSFDNVKSDKFKNDLALGWYRDFRYKDLTEVQRISFGKCITRNFIFETTNLVKLKVSIDKLLKKNKIIYLFKDNSNFFRLVKILTEFSLKYKSRIIFLVKENQNYIGSSPLAKRGHIIGFKNKFILFFLVRFLQKFISFFLNKKILYFVDWSSTEYFKKSKKLLFLNNKNLLKSFCLYRPLFYKKKLFENDNKLFKFKLDIKNIKNIFVKNKLAYNQETYDLLNFVQKKLFRENLNYILDYIKIYSETIDFYKPKAIIVPSGTAFHFSILTEVAKKKKCKMILSIDGYQTVKDYVGLHYDILKKKSAYDYILCPGKKYLELIQDHKISKSSLISVYPPIFSNYINIKKNNIKPKYDAMIIGYIPNTRNINCLYDSYIDTELEILDVFNNLRYKRVAIKIKSGNHLMVPQQKQQENYYKSLYKKKFNKKLKLEISFEGGELFEKINYSKIIVGAFSTAYVEALYNKKQFYVYEPKRNGLTIEQLKSNKICDLKYILNSKSILEKNIRLKNFLKIKKSFFSGAKIQKLDMIFNDILND